MQKVYFHMSPHMTLTYEIQELKGLGLGPVWSLLHSDSPMVCVLRVCHRMLKPNRTLSLLSGMKSPPWGSKPLCLFLVPVPMINTTTKTTRGRKGFFHLTAYSPSWRVLRAGSPGMNLRYQQRQRPGRRAASDLLLVACFSYHPGPPIQWGWHHSWWTGSSHQTLIRKISPQTYLQANLMETFS